jgi:RsiW-degrading membrane proteinase PrsW (M82 family)
MIGIFSGLGFAAFENMSYGQSAIYQSALMAKKAGVAGAAAGTRGAMIHVMLRSLSLVFCHATFSGIFAYFVTTGFATGKRFVAMVLIGLSVSAILHGAYDWLTSVQMTMATGVVILSFVLFYAYLTKLNQLLGSDPDPKESAA